MNRRGVIGAIAGAGIFGPKAAKAVVENIASAPEVGPPTAAYPRGAGIPGWQVHSVQPYDDAPPPIDMSEPSSWVSFLRDRVMREEYRSLLFEQYRVINKIDADIDVHRSFSTMAKVTYQRQRDVDRAMATRETGGPFSRVRDMLERVFGRVTGLHHL